jgi:outer membrane protein OmpA-like peptidoglycan-associated protein
MKTIASVFITAFLFISFNSLSQKHKTLLDDYTCFPNQKHNNFMIGDTVYVWARHSKQEWNTLEFYYSPLLDSLAKSLIKNPDLALIIKGFDYMASEFINDEKWGDIAFKKAKKWTLDRAISVKEYLNEKGATNCMLCFAMGAKNYSNKAPKNDYDAQCYDLVQILLVKSSFSICYTTQTNIPIVLQNIYFGTNKWNILPKSYTELNQLSDYLLSNPAKAIEISGHTDNTGLENKNIILSQKRADAIKEYLLQKGIKNKILTKGYGSSKPIASNKTEEGKAKNRRIEIKIIKE